MALIRGRAALLAAALAACAVPARAAAPVETLVEAPGAAGPLRGTMLAPNPRPGRSAVVLITPISIEQDRDGNPLAAGTGRPGTYRRLAEGLAARGVTVVRVGKRSAFGNGGAVIDPYKVTVADYADDLRAWARFLRRQTDTPCISIFAQGLSGLEAMVAAAGRQEICGLLLASVTGNPLAAHYRELWAAVAPPLHDELMTAIDGIAGERDARLLASADPAAKLVLLPDVNTIFRAVTSDDPKANAATYADPTLPLAPGVIDAIVDFLAEHPAP